MMPFVEDSTHSEALFAVSVYLTKSSRFPIRYYFGSLASAQAAADKAIKAGWANRVLVVERATPDDFWKIAARSAQSR